MGHRPRLPKWEQQSETGDWTMRNLEDLSMETHAAVRILRQFKRAKAPLEAWRIDWEIDLDAIGARVQRLVTRGLSSDAQGEHSSCKHVCSCTISVLNSCHVPCFDGVQKASDPTRSRP